VDEQTFGNLLSGEPDFRYSRISRTKEFRCFW